MMVIVSLFSFFSCSNDAPFTLDGNSVLISNRWNLDAFRMGMEYKVLLTKFKVEINALDSARDCELEDVIVFSPDATYQVVDEGLVCDETPADNIRESGYWTLNADQKSLKIDLLRNQNYLKDLQNLDVENTTFQILEFREDYLKLELRLDEAVQDAPFGLPDDYEIIITLELTPEP